MKRTYIQLNEWEFEVEGLAQSRLVYSSDGTTPDEYELEWLIEPEIVNAWKNGDLVPYMLIPRLINREVMRMIEDEPEDLII